MNNSSGGGGVATAQLDPFSTFIVLANAQDPKKTVGEDECITVLHY